MEYEINEQERVFKEEFESYKNGNITDFKYWLSRLIPENVIYFIKWLQENDLKL